MKTNIYIDNVKSFTTEMNIKLFEDENYDIISDIYNICCKEFPNNEWNDLVCDTISYNKDSIEIYVSSYNE